MNKTKLELVIAVVLDSHLICVSNRAQRTFTMDFVSIALSWFRIKRFFIFFSVFFSVSHLLFPPFVLSFGIFGSLIHTDDDDKR